MIIQLRYRNYYQRANGVALIDIISVIWIELRLMCKALHLYAGLFFMQSRGVVKLASA